jgi:hypothetical protein
LWLAGGLVFGGIIWLSQGLSAGLASGIVLVLAAWGMLRYADRLMAVVAYGAFISLIFHFFIGHGSFGLMTLPFIIMGVSIILYLLFTNVSGKAFSRHYHACLLLWPRCYAFIFRATITSYKASMRPFMAILRPSH